MSVEDVVNAVAKVCLVSADAIRGRRRVRTFERARSLAAHVLREDGKKTFSEIGAALGGRRHPAVYTACRKIRSELRRDALLARQLARVRALLRQDIPSTWTPRQLAQDVLDSFKCGESCTEKPETCACCGEGCWRCAAAQALANEPD